jgi:hypothetical protein
MAVMVSASVAEGSSKPGQSIKVMAKVWASWLGVLCERMLTV